MIEVFDDYLGPVEHDRLCSYFMGNYDKGDIANSCCWIFNGGVSQPGDGHFQHIHQLFSCHQIISPAWSLVQPIIEKEEALAIARVKANMLVRTPEVEVFDDCFHCDFDCSMSHMNTAIYYINTNNGFTLFEDGTKVESVTNRLVRFPSNLKHTGSTCSDADRRILINFNYFTERCLQQNN